MSNTLPDKASPSLNLTPGQHGFLSLTVAALALLALFTGLAAAAQRSPKLLASDAGRLYRQAQDLGGDSKAEAYYRILAIADIITTSFPNSIEAAVLKTGRVLNTPIRIPDIKPTAEAWASSHPDAAQTAKAGVTQAAANDQPTDGTGGAPDVQTTDRVNNGVVARLDDQTRSIKLPPLLKNKLPAIDTGPNDPRKVPTVSGPVKKVSRSEVFASLEKAVVLIIYVATQKDEFYVYGTGTGFFIAPNRILTNAHVANMASDVWDEYKAEGFFLIVNQDIGMREAKIVTIASRDTSLNIDAALLEPVNFTSPNYLSFAGDSQIGEWIAIGGFPGKATEVDAAMSELMDFIERKKLPPLPPTAIPTLRVDDGILSNKYVNKSSRALTLQYSLETTGGNSGSPIVNACGEVVGLHYSGTRERAVVQKSDSGNFYVDVDASKYNSAVASKEIRYFLDRVGLTVRFDDDPCQVG